MGVLGIQEHISECGKLAMKLGVPNDHVQECQSLDLKLGDVMSLLYWRNGKSGKDFPNTWRFLLETVKEHYGPLVTKELSAAAEENETWSVPMNRWCVPLYMLTPHGCHPCTCVSCWYMLTLHRCHPCT